MSVFPQLPTLTRAGLTLRGAREDDVAVLAGILADPEVRRWWGAYDEAKVRTELSAQPCWTVVVDGRTAGWVQVVEERWEGYENVSFDVALAAFGRNRGIGRTCLHLAVAHFAAAGHHRFTIDPALENEAAIRCYRSVGFRPVGVMREYEREPDGSWRDALLMDLLARELIDP